ncbi:hypothetical protein IFM89_008760 [Coptis chinensis]|uniref:MPN domain-containing protein n=1 Tax=Coptis chinensis TaxID=261450 RepID=A0A835GXI8_9MAGN|nr:hypothetical protein IFM89_008760 [Coptis chinensis]
MQIKVITLVMGGELKYEIGQNAYIKLVLHALKHKASAVNGVLIGRLIKDEVVEISDAVPLSHSHIGLLPTLEIALIQIEEHFGSQGLSVVGYYHANERFDDLELGNVAKKIGDHIYRYFPQVSVLLLDNKKLESLIKGKDRNPVVQSTIKRNELCFNEPYKGPASYATECDRLQVFIGTVREGFVQPLNCMKLEELSSVSLSLVSIVLYSHYCYEVSSLVPISSCLCSQIFCTSPQGPDFDLLSCTFLLMKQLYTRDLSKNWKQAGSGGSGSLTLKEPSANIVLLDYIVSQKWEGVVDFDDHLDDISKDWLNPDLFK